MSCVDILILLMGCVTGYVCYRIKIMVDKAIEFTGEDRRKKHRRWRL